VLSNGENVEPQGIEDLVTAKSNLVDQMMCVGQDEKSVGAIVVPNPGEMGRRGYITKETAGKQVGSTAPTISLHCALIFMRCTCR